jgi:hypothetical protein
MPPTFWTNESVLKMHKSQERTKSKRKMVPKVKYSCPNTRRHEKSPL